MSENRELICIGCPMGCSLKITLVNGCPVEVKGNTCPRGKIYAEKECTNPTRIVTSCVKVINGKIDVVSVKTERDIPKNKIFQCIEKLHGLQVEAPVRVGQILLQNVADTGVDIVATKEVNKK